MTNTFAVSVKYITYSHSAYIHVTETSLTKKSGATASRQKGDLIGVSTVIRRASSVKEVWRKGAQTRDGSERVALSEIARKAGRRLAWLRRGGGKAREARQREVSGYGDTFALERFGELVSVQILAPVALTAIAHARLYLVSFHVGIGLHRPA